MLTLSSSFFTQLGRIISSNSAPAATLNRSERGRTVIEELVRDAEAAAYAKKKFNEVNIAKSFDVLILHADPASFPLRSIRPKATWHGVAMSDVMPRRAKEAFAIASRFTSVLLSHLDCIFHLFL